DTTLRRPSRKTQARSRSRGAVRRLQSMATTTRTRRTWPRSSLPPPRKDRRRGPSSRPRITAKSGAGVAGAGGGAVVGAAAGEPTPASVAGSDEQPEFDYPSEPAHAEASPSDEHRAEGRGRDNGAVTPSVVPEAAAEPAPSASPVVAVPEHVEAQTE